MRKNLTSANGQLATSASLLLADLNVPALAFVYSGHISNLLTNLAHNAMLTQLASQKLR